MKVMNGFRATPFSVKQKRKIKAQTNLGTHENTISNKSGKLPNTTWGFCKTLGSQQATLW